MRSRCSANADTPAQAKPTTAKLTNGSTSQTVKMTSGTSDCTLTADQAGDGNYNAAATFVRTVSAQKANQVITFTQPTTPQSFNATFTIQPTADSGLDVSVVPTGGCTWNDNSTTAKTTNGTTSQTVKITSATVACVLTASQAGDATYSAATDVARTVATQKLTQTITFTQPTTPQTLNATFTIQPTSDSGLDEIGRAHV